MTCCLLIHHLHRRTRRRSAPLQSRHGVSRHIGPLGQVFTVPRVREERSPRPRSNLLPGPRHALPLIWDPARPSTPEERGGEAGHQADEQRHETKVGCCLFCFHLFNPTSFLTSPVLRPDSFSFNTVILQWAHSRSPDGGRKAEAI